MSDAPDDDLLDSELLLGDSTGVVPDLDRHVLGEDDGSAAIPAEEAAMHVISEDELEA